MLFRSQVGNSEMFNGTSTIVSKYGTSTIKFHSIDLAGNIEAFNNIDVNLKMEILIDHSINNSTSTDNSTSTTIINDLAITSTHNENGNMNLTHAVKNKHQITGSSNIINNKTLAIAPALTSASETVYSTTSDLVIFENKKQIPQNISKSLKVSTKPNQSQISNMAAVIQTDKLNKSSARLIFSLLLISIIIILIIKIFYKNQNH